MRSLVVACLLLSLPAYSYADEAVDYEHSVKPILAARCFACHSGLKQNAQLRLDTGASMLKGGDSGPAIKPGQSDQSLLIEKISAAEESERMRPEGKPLTPEQIAIWKTWINQGAKVPADE